MSRYVTPRKISARYAELIQQITKQRTDAAMAKVLSIGMTGAKQLAPLEYGTLMDSGFRRIVPLSSGLRGIAGFTVNYAYFLHENTNWSPLAPKDKRGPAWNQDATPKFLERGFTDEDQFTLMKRALVSTYRL